MLQGDTHWIPENRFPGSQGLHTQDSLWADIAASLPHTLSLALAAEIELGVWVPTDHQAILRRTAQPQSMQLNSPWKRN